MNYIESVEIQGFWGTKTVRIHFDRDINFLIGANGSGKTTIINLIASALKADISTLYSIQFDKMILRLKTPGVNRKPVIEITKVIDDLMGSIDLTYLIKEKTTEKGQTFGVEGPYDQRIYRDPRYPRQRRMQEAGVRLANILSEVVEVNWLSVHRGAFDRFSRTSRDDEFETVIDLKIAEISRKFASYFSLLDSRANEETKNFQEYVFLSLLEQEHSGSEVFQQAQIEPEDKSIVVGILKDLGVSNTKATKSVNSHYNRLSAAIKTAKEDRSVTIMDAIALSDARRIRAMVAKWRELNSAREKIFNPKAQFERIVNHLLSGKELHFDQRNAPTVHLLNGDKVNVNVLSSGEKQLFILLGEALLQEERPVIFISDEPELSLHVSWQSTLFENIRSLNSAGQIISATHSPDIVGPFQDKVIQIDSCIFDV